jgi:hypothetical protein
MAGKPRTQADRQRSADIRDWAGANGLQITERGRIPAAVVAAYDAAMTVPADDDGPGPDWSAAAGAVPLDLDGPEPEDLLEDPPGAAAGPGIAPEPPGPPPPASLDDARTRLAGRGPRVPPWAGGRGGGGSQRPAAAPVKITPALSKDITGKLALFLAIPAATWAAVDPACGGAFSENLDTITAKAVPLILQSPEAVRWFTQGGKYLLWLDLLIALQPVAQTAYRHHLAGTITVVQGRPVPARRLADGKVVPADHAPAEPAPDWSAYTTDVPGHVPPVQRVAGQ